MHCVITHERWPLSLHDVCNLRIVFKCHKSPACGFTVCIIILSPFNNVYLLKDSDIYDAQQIGEVESGNFEVIIEQT